jgi:predicted N-acetyltransferase YhbS
MWKAQSEEGRTSHYSLYASNTKHHFEKQKETSLKKSYFQKTVDHSAHFLFPKPPFLMAFRSFSDSNFLFRPMHCMSPDSITSGNTSGGVSLRNTSLPWMRFTWQTSELPGPLSKIETSDLIRTATREESGKVLEVIMHSLSMDSLWNDSKSKVEQYLKNAVERLFSQDDPLCLVIPKGNRLIAISLLDPAMDALSHLLSGPIILVEYHNRGIGSRLLEASLAALRDRGHAKVTGLTRVNTLASRYLYPKFGGLGETISFPLHGETSHKAKA